MNKEGDYIRNSMDDIEKLPIDAPLERVPQQELEVIFLFAEHFKSLGFTKIKKIQSKFPDCIALRKTDSGINEVRIEFELRSINFYAHGHDPEKCDCIVCWEDNWIDKPQKLEVIELRKHYGVSPKIWVMAVGNDYKEELSAVEDEWEWTVPSKSHAGDLILFYYNAPESCIKDIFVINGQYSKQIPGSWTIKKKDVFASISRISSIQSPLSYKEIKTDAILSNSNMVAMHMQGKFNVTGEWKRLYDLIITKNPELEKELSDFSPEKISKLIYPGTDAD
jgi:hypothetical protein